MTTFTKAQYKEIVRVLEKEKEFFQRYGAKLSDRNSTYGKRRSIISQFLSTWRGAGGYEQPLMSWPTWVGRNDIEDRDQIRRYFDDLWNIDQVEPNKYASIPSVWDELKLDIPKYAGLLYDAAITLENDSTFCKAYNNCHGLGGDHRRMTIERFLKKCCGYFYPAAVVDTDDYLERLRQYFDDTMMPHHPCKSGALPSREAIEFWRDEVRHPEDCARHKAKAEEKDPHAHLRTAMRAGATIEFCISAAMWRTLADQSPTRAFTFPPERYRIKSEAKPVNKMSLDEIAAELTTPQPQPESIMSKPITITTKTFANGTDISTMADAEVFNLIAEQEAEIEGLKKIKAQPKKLIDEIAKREAGIAALVTYLDNAKS
jgi:hypothetical protein